MGEAAYGAGSGTIAGPLSGSTSVSGAAGGGGTGGATLGRTVCTGGVDHVLLQHLNLTLLHAIAHLDKETAGAAPRHARPQGVAGYGQKAESMRDGGHLRGVLQWTT